MLSQLAGVISFQYNICLADSDGRCSVYSVPSCCTSRPGLLMQASMVSNSAPRYPRCEASEPPRKRKRRAASELEYFRQAAERHQSHDCYLTISY